MSEVPECRNCAGVGWVCENHFGAPWDDSADHGCQCGAGAPCPVCCFDMASAGVIGSGLRASEVLAEAIRRGAPDPAAIHAAAIAQAVEWHEAEIARLEQQIAENDAYCLRIGERGGDASEANRNCGAKQRALQEALAAIRALAPDPTLRVVTVGQLDALFRVVTFLVEDGDTWACLPKDIRDAAMAQFGLLAEMRAIAEGK